MGRPTTRRRPSRALGERLAVSVVVTLGERGALVVSRAEPPGWVEAPTVDAVDTTGAGDAFVGAFAVGLAMGRSPLAAARLGCVAAADSVTRRGTQASYPDRPAAARIMARAAG